MAKEYINMVIIKYLLYSLWILNSEMGIDLFHQIEFNLLTIKFQVIHI
jgi:hypothetical protein